MSLKPKPTPNPAPLSFGGLDDALGFRLRMLEQRIVRNFAHHMDALEISPTLYSILVLIEANPKCRQSELSQALGMHQSNLVERMGLLIERGLVARSAVSGDRRASALELTFAGRHFMEKLTAAHDEHLADIRAYLGADRYEALLQLTSPKEEDG